MTVIDSASTADMMPIAAAATFMSVDEDRMERGASTVMGKNASSSGAEKPKTRTNLSRFIAVTAAVLVVMAVVSVSMYRPGAIHPTINTADESSKPSTRASRRLQSSDGNLMVGAYYYPWHAGDFHSGGGFLRQDLEPEQQLPELGLYDDRKPEVVNQHLEWSRQANIGLWVTSWWGAGNREDLTTRNTILKHDNLGDMKIAVHYETLGRVKADEEYDTNRVPTDMEHICEHYFSHDNYYRIDGRPVMFMYLTRYLYTRGKIEEVAALMRSAANKCGESLYIVGDHAFNTPPAENELFMPFQYLDAVTNYDVYGSMGATSTYAGSENVDRYYAEQRTWRDRAASHGCGYVSAAAPGYNDRSVRLDANHTALSRRLTENDAEGSLFDYALVHARDVVDEATDNLLMINSFNEWHEDTQLEPVAVTETETSDPEVLTNGVKYGGYGELYLDILREKTLGFTPTPFTSTLANQR